MKVEKTKLDGCVIITPKIFGDDRGHFLETYHFEKYKREANLHLPFVQDNYSTSTKGVLRGLHFQKKNPQGKLVTVTKGEVYDVAVDLRPESSTFGHYEAVILNATSKKQFYIPPGFAHGFQVLSEVAHFQYKCTNFYDPTDESGIIWNDREINICWPNKAPVLSEKDKKLPSFNEFKSSIFKG